MNRACSSIIASRWLATDPRSVTHSQREIDTVELGRRVRERREQLGLVQTDLAEAVGVRGLAISELELGKTANPMTKTVAAIARRLGVTVDYLLYGYDEATIDESSGDSVATTYDQDVEWAAEQAGLDDGEKVRLAGVQRMIGRPARSLLLTNAEAIRAERAGKLQSTPPLKPRTLPPGAMKMPPKKKKT